MKTLKEIFDDVTLIGQTPNLIMKVQLPDKIFDEVKSWIEPCRAIKDDEYAELLNNRNVGTGNNSYQTSIPKKYIDNSFFLGYVIHFGELYLKTTNQLPAGNSRIVNLHNCPGHYDGYDIWVNFAYKGCRGNGNALHNYAGALSGIICIKDEHKQPTHFPEINYTHQPEEGEILIFPSHLMHFVDAKETESERITSNFNLNVFRKSNR